jgi:hypothetical protein
LGAPYIVEMPPSLLVVLVIIILYIAYRPRKEKMTNEPCYTVVKGAPGVSNPFYHVDPPCEETKEKFYVGFTPDERELVASNSYV